MRLRPEREYPRTLRSLRDRSDDTTGIPGGEYALRNIARDDTAGADHGSRSNTNAWQNDRAASDPDIRPDLDRLTELLATPCAASSGCIGV